MPVQLTTALRVVGTSLFALAVLGGILAAYVTGYQFIHTEKHYLSFGLYGAILGLHLLIQSLFAFLEHRRMRRAGRTLKLPSPLRRSVALCIAAYQEDPDYLRKCLRSAQRIAFPDLKVVLVVDGNRQEDAYMLDIFHEVLGGTEPASSCGAATSMRRVRVRRRPACRRAWTAFGTWCGPAPSRASCRSGEASERSCTRPSRPLVIRWTTSR